MAEAFGGLQTADAFVGLATAVIRLVQYFKKLSRVPQDIKAVRSSIDGFAWVLFAIEATCKRRSEHFTPEALQILAHGAGRCAESLIAIESILSAFPTDEEGQSSIGLRDRKKFLKELPHIAVSLEALDRQKLDLIILLTLLNQDVYANTTTSSRQDTKAESSSGQTNAGASEAADFADVESITTSIQFSKLLQKGDRPPNEGDPGYQRTDSIIPGFRPSDNIVVNLERIEKTANELEQFCKAETLQSRAGQDSSMDDGGGVTGPSRTWLGSRKEFDECQETSQERSNGLLDEPPSHTPEALDSIIRSYHNEGLAQLENLQFAKAKLSLGEAIGLSEQREKYYKTPFHDRIRVNEDLARAYVGLRHWDKAIVTLNSCPPVTTGIAEDDGSAFARRSQLLASIYLDRYMSGLSRQTEDGDWTSARNTAHNALIVWDRRMPLTSIESDLRRSCLHILVRVYRCRNKVFEAEHYQELLDGPKLTQSITVSDLRNAVKASDKALLQQHLTAWVDIDTSDERGTALHYAAKTGNVAMTSWLLEQGADANRADESQETALSKAIRRGHSDVVSILLKWRGGVLDLTGKQDRQGTLLHLAAKSRNVTSAGLLLDARPSLLDQKDRYGQTPLHYSVVENANFEMTALLLDRGAALNEKDNTGRTPMYLLLLQQTPDNKSFRLLEDQGAVVGGLKLTDRQERQREACRQQSGTGSRRATYDGPPVLPDAVLGPGLRDSHRGLRRQGSV